MKTSFLDATYRRGQSVFLIHGYLEDFFLAPDLVLRDFDACLNRLLRSRGFGDVIYYSANGFYVMDAASARSLLSTDAPIPRVYDVEDASPCAGAPSAVASPAALRPTVRTLLRRNDSASPAPDSAAAAPPSPAPAPAATYARRNMSMEEFIPLIEGRLTKPCTRPIAVVFSDIVASRLGDHQKLLHDLLITVEQNRYGHAVFLCAPGANSSALMQTLDRVRLTSKFVSGGSFLKENTVCISLPDQDEIMNLLHRLQIVGHEGRRLRLIGDAATLAGEVLTCSRVKCSGTMRHIWSVLTRLMTQSDQPELSSDIIHQLWEVPKAPVGDPLESMNKAGWESVYDHMKTLQTSLTRRLEPPPPLIPVEDVAVNRLCDTPSLDNRKRPDIPCFLLLGSPGTGKTTIARLIGQWLKQIGVVKRGHMVEVDKTSLSSIYHGGVEQNCLDAIDRAEEGVLFIDEASSLAARDGGANHDGTGSLVVNSLLAALTDPNRHFCLVLACYTDYADKLLALNPGLTRRLGNNIITIDDYTPPLLLKIFLDTVSSNGARVDKALLNPFADCPASSPLLSMFQRIYDERVRSSFGNADVAVKLANFCTGLTDDRVIRQEHLCQWAGITPGHFQCRNTKNDLTTILSDFDETLVGMPSVRELLIRLSRRVRAAQDNRMSIESVLSKPLLFVGNAGVGKTSVCRLLARMYHGLGLVSSSEPLFCNASELGSSAEVNASAKAILEWVDKARDTGMILVIDEAHQLCSNGHRYEAFTALMSEITRADKPPLYLALTSYPETFKTLLGADQGASRRFNAVFLQDYSGSELLQILEKMAARTLNLTLLPEAKELLLPHLDHIAAHPGRIRNGGCVEALLKDGCNGLPSIFDRLLARLDRHNIPFDAPDARLVTAADVPLDTLAALSSAGALPGS